MSVNTTKRGFKNGVQTYVCKECDNRFSSKRRTKIAFIKQLWCDYVFHKQTVRELAKHYKKDRRTIKALLETYTPRTKQHRPRSVYLVVDATYFGERVEHKSWCVVVARDAHTKENLWWTYTNNETTAVYRKMREELEALGYTIKSVTGDGFGGIRAGFVGIPYQMCHVHMERVVIKGTTRNPQLEAGQVLLALVKTLPDTDCVTFRKRLHRYIEHYRDFLNEKTYNPFTGTYCWTHEPLRRALHSLMTFELFLFTFEQDRSIPKTTNSLEGHFRHINEVTAIHCGLSRAHKEKVLHSLLLAGTIAPNKKKLDEIL